VKNHNLDKENFRIEIKQLQETGTISENLHLIILELAKIIKQKDKYRNYPDDWKYSAYAKVIEFLNNKPNQIDPEKQPYSYIYKIISFFYIDQIKALKRRIKTRESFIEHDFETTEESAIVGKLFGKSEKKDYITEEEAYEYIGNKEEKSKKAEERVLW